MHDAVEFVSDGAAQYLAVVSGDRLHFCTVHTAEPASAMFREFSKTIPRFGECLWLHWRVGTDHVLLGSFRKDPCIPPIRFAKDICVRICGLPKRCS
jgi:hypothetical protein